MTITVVGLGPGDPVLLTRQAWQVLSRADEVYLRTIRHPTVAGLPPSVALCSFDDVYENASDLAAVYETIVERVLALGRRPQGVLYAVPGHPLIGEATVTLLLERAGALGIAIEVISGLSFIEPVLVALQVDGMAGLQVVDALDVAQCLHPALNPDAPALLGQLYSKDVASEVKLTLMSQYPDEHPVVLVHAAGTDQQLVERVPLHMLDHSVQIAHLTALFLPPLPHTSGLESFQNTIAHLRSPDGCPWDQVQTHQSLRAGFLEESAEVLAALDANDMAALCEELGDVLLHIIMQSQIATEEGEFRTSDIIAGIEAKIRRRHPHVFSHTTAPGINQVLEDWDATKERERLERNEEFESALGVLPPTLSALAQAEATSRRAARAGFAWLDMQGVVDQVREEAAELLAAQSPAGQEVEVGDLLFAVVNWARWLGIESESALRLAVRRFRQRFLGLEATARRQAIPLDQLDTATLLKLWQQAGSDANGA